METVTITRDLLRSMPISRPEGGDKHDRGVVLVIGGSVEQPGGAILAAISALRAGAGKARIATCASIAPHIAASFPETRVYALDETAGSIDPRAADQLEKPVAEADAVLIGPGMVDPVLAGQLASAVVGRIDKQTVILDAAALKLLSDDNHAVRHLRGRCVITPHRGEMTYVAHLPEDAIDANPAGVAARCADETGAVVALKGDETFIVAPASGTGGLVSPGEAIEGGGRTLFRNTAGNVGLATSGSGDVLSGILAALAARNVDPLTAAAWAVYLHAVAGDRLAQKVGIGFLAREIADEIPHLLADLWREGKE